MDIKQPRNIIIWVVILTIFVLLSACSETAIPPTEPPPTREIVQVTAEAEPTQAPTEAPIPPEPTTQATGYPPPPTEPAQPSPYPAVPTAAPPTAYPAPDGEESIDEEQELAPLAPDPQNIAFLAEDGQELDGIYYPAAVNPAPVVVLMHWAPGDQTDWSEIAFWLQNRDQGGNAEIPGSRPWLDPSWFPEMPTDRSFAVFTFTFRECQGGCKSILREIWLLDAQAAMNTAASLEGVDPNQMVAIGASIGADGAIDGCTLLNQATDDTHCLGALSISPGSYLTVDYATAVETIETEEFPKPAWCLYATGDDASAAACQSATGNLYRSEAYDGSGHGMELFDPGLTPAVPDLILEFLGLTLG